MQLLTPEERDRIVAEQLRTLKGKTQLRKAIQLGAAKAADKLREGSVGWRLARKIAGLPV